MDDFIIWYKKNKKKLKYLFNFINTHKYNYLNNCSFYDFCIFVYTRNH